MSIDDGGHKVIRIPRRPVSLRSRESPAPFFLLEFN
jgi:hypothetical protein